MATLLNCLPPKALVEQSWEQSIIMFLQTLSNRSYSFNCLDRRNYLSLHKRNSCKASRHVDFMMSYQIIFRKIISRIIWHCSCLLQPMVLAQLICHDKIHKWNLSEIRRKEKTFLVPEILKWSITREEISSKRSCFLHVTPWYSALLSHFGWSKII